ncbi:hypothetical protein ACT453_35445, partial [Bacillus sp. D-CC]
FKQINLYQLKTLKMFNVPNPANAVVVGIIAIIATVSLLIWKFNFYHCITNFNCMAKIVTK